MNKQLETIMQKEMTRSQFLKHIGILLIGVFGFSSVLTVLLNPEKNKQLTESPKPRGFGTGKFGV